MSDGRTHGVGANITIVAAAAIGLYYLPPETVALLAPGFILGKFAGPDERDQERQRNYGEQLVYDFAGPVVGTLWQAYWWPLAKRIPHRDWRSHFPGPATLIAWLYLFGPVLLFVGLLYRPYFEPLLAFLAYQFIGWFIQDCVHVAMDIVHSSLVKMGFRRGLHV